MTTATMPLNRIALAVFAAASLVLAGCSQEPAPGGEHDHGHDHGHDHSHDHSHSERGEELRKRTAAAVEQQQQQQGESAEAGKPAEEAAAGHGHHHAAPHGGTLVAMGDHVAHLEFVAEESPYRLVVYVLDGEAEKPIRLQQAEIVVTVDLAGQRERLTLAAVANELTGEKVGDTSQFAGDAWFLKETSEFDAVIERVEVLGQEVEGLAFSFPKGLE